VRGHGTAWGELTGPPSDSLRCVVLRNDRQVKVGSNPAFVVTGNIGFRNYSGHVATYQKGTLVRRGSVLIPPGKDLGYVAPNNIATGNNIYIGLESITTSTTNHTLTLTIENLGTSPLTLTIEVLDGNGNPVTVTVTGLPASLAPGTSVVVQVHLPADVVQPITILVKQGTQTLVEMPNINSSIPTPAPPANIISLSDAALLPITETLVVVPGAGSIYFLENGTQKTVPPGALADWIIVPSGVPVVQQATPSAQIGKVVVPNSAHMQSLPAPVSWTIYEIQSQGIAIADGYMGVSP